jgi:hyaluronoglucosaminidase
MLTHAITCLLGLLWAAGRAQAQFDVMWNVPTFMCHKYGIFFNVSRFGIKQNYDDQFRGDSMVILYDPGLFPAFLSDEPQDEGIYESLFGKQQYSVVARNGGLPQLGNLSQHLEAIRASVSELVPDPMFSGMSNFYFNV